MGFIFSILGAIEVHVESTVQPSATEVVSSSPTIKSSSVDEIMETETSDPPYMTTVEIGPTVSMTTTDAPSSSSASPHPDSKSRFTIKFSTNFQQNKNANTANFVQKLIIIKTKFTYP